MRLFLVRNSFAEKTPLKFSPGIPMNLGRPAPEPTNTAANPSSSRRESIVTVLPAITFVSIFTPRAFTDSISAATTLSFGRRNSGIPYSSTPPGRWRASKIVTSYPSFARSDAHARPAGPLPITAILWPFAGAISGFTPPFSRLQSATKRSSFPIATGSPFTPRIQLPSHCVSCGHTRPQIAGRDESSAMTAAAAAKLPAAT